MEWIEKRENRGGEVKGRIFGEIPIFTGKIRTLTDFPNYRERCW